MSTHTATGYLVLRARQYSSSPTGAVQEVTINRLVKNRPALNEHEVAVKVTITLPDTAFTIPPYQASIEVNERDVIHPEITVETEDGGQS